MKFTKEQALALFPDNKAAQTKVKAMYQGLALAKKPQVIEVESEKALKAKVEEKLNAPSKRATTKAVMDLVNTAKKFGVKEEAILEAIKNLYKEEANKKSQEKIQALEAKIEALKKSMM